MTTTTTSRSTRSSSKTLLAAVGAGAVLAATLTTVLDASAAAQPDPPSSRAYGIAATGVDPADPTPVVSSDGKVKTASGNAAGNAGTFTASGITVKAGDGMAEAHVASLQVGGQEFGPITTTCADGVTTVKHPGTKPSGPNLTVTYGEGGGSEATGATITITGAGEETAQTITAAYATCGKATQKPDPTTTAKPDPTGNNGDDGTGGGDGGQDDGTGRANGDGDRDGGSIGSATGSTGQVRPAPRPTPKQGHHPVTG